MPDFAQKQNRPEPAASPGPERSRARKPAAAPRYGAGSRSHEAESSRQGNHDHFEEPARLEPPAFLQTKPIVSAPTDLHEQEADRIADRAAADRPAPQPAPVPTRRVESPDAGHAAAPPLVRDMLRSPGRPLDPATLALMHDRLGENFSAVRIHTDQEASDLARHVDARAFTVGHHIGFAPGQYAPQTAEGQKLLAHELAHVLQQGPGAGNSAASSEVPSRLSRKAGDHQPDASSRAMTDNAKPAASEDVAPGVMELKGQPDFAPPPAIAAFLDKHKKGKVIVRFGKLATGPIEVTGRGGKYRVNHQYIPLSHPLFARVADVAPELAPRLMLHTDSTGKLHGSVSFAKGGDLAAHLHKAPELAGLTGFSLASVPKLSNQIDNGSLHIAMKAVPIKIGSAFAGTFDLEAIDENISFNGTAAIKVTGLAKGELSLQRSTEGVVTGSASIALQLPKNFSGSMSVVWNGAAVTGEAKVGYQGEKLSGYVLLKLMEKGEAERLAAEKKDPPKESAEAAAPAAQAKVKPKAKEVDYVVFGEGDLAFAFNEWLTGTAHAIVDYKGYVTLVTKITPQKQLRLFDKSYVEPIGSPIEVDAVWGLPVIANVYIGASGGLSASAQVLGILDDIVVTGDYSTDPAKCNDFTFEGHLNISATAGLTLALRVFAGITILKHKIQAGGELDGTIGIHGYVDAHPVIGYREKASNGEDKKGEFFIQGDADIAAQAFFALSGNVFVELITPWWSPLDDRHWPWPLGSKEWPLGSSFGVGMTVDYVFGSGQWPTVKFKPADFSAEKLMTDLIHENVPEKSGGKAPQKSPWHEKNTAAAPVPAKTTDRGGARPGAAAGKPAAKGVSRRGASGASDAPVDPRARTADGKTVQEHMEHAAKRGKKEPGPQIAKSEAKGAAKDAPAATAKDAPPAKKETKEDHEQKWERGVHVVKQALAYAERTGIDRKELDQVLKSIKRRSEYGFSELHAEDGGEEWNVVGSMSAARPITKTKKAGSELPLSVIADHKTKTIGACTVGKRVKAEPLSKRPPADSSWRGSEPGYGNAFFRAVNQREYTYVQGHLLNHHVFGPGHDFNLVPIHRRLNSQMSAKCEEKVKAAVISHNKVVSYEIDVTFGNWSPSYKHIPEENDLPTAITLKAYEMTRKADTKGDRPEHWKIDKEIYSDKLDNERGPDVKPDTPRHFKRVNLNSRAENAETAFKSVYGIGDAHAKWLVDHPRRYTTFEDVISDLALPAKETLNRWETSTDPVVALDGKTE